MASLIFNTCLDALNKGNIDFENDAIYLLLVTSSYVPDKDAHDFRDDVTNEVSGVGYTAGGQQLGVTVTQDNVNDRVDITFDDEVWAAVSGFTTTAGVIYKNRGGASSADELIAYVDFGSSVAVSGGAFTVSFSTPLRFQN